MSGRGQTPARITRSRANTPLPALQTRQSHAYGAAGKASLHTQVTTSHAALDQAFKATARESHEPTPGARRSTRIQKTQSVVEEPVEPEIETEEVVEAEPENEIEDEPTQTPEDDRPGTSLQDSALYANRPPPTFTTAPPPPRQRDQSRQQPRTERRRPRYEPPRYRIFLRTMTKFLPYWAGFFFIYTTMLIGLIASLLGMYAVLPLSDLNSDTRDRVFRGVRVAIGLPAYDQPPSRVETMWHAFKSVQIWNETLPGLQDIDEGLQHLINWNLLSRLNATAETLQQMNKHLNEIDDQLRSQDDAIQDIQRFLPQGLALVEQNGNWVIPPQFWNALLEKMSSEEASPLWESFVSANAQHILDVEDKFYAGKVNAAQLEGRLLSQAALHTALERNRRLMEKSIDEKMETIKTHVLYESRQELLKTIKEHSIRDTTNLARWNILQNMEQRLRERNFFSPGLGAVIDPYHTSRTFKDLTTMQYLGMYGWWMTGLAAHRMPQLPQNPPVAALLGWEEATQCWCAAHDRDQQAQLGISLAFKIHPEYLMIEHIPAEGTLDIAAAPRRWEMWAQVESESEAVRMKAVLEQRASAFTANPCGEPPKDSSKNWVCVASNEYNIHDSDFVKSFPVDYWRGTLDDDVLLTDKIVIKVLENWGAPDHTCLYRVRLTGTQREALEHNGSEHEYTS